MYLSKILLLSFIVSVIEIHLGMQCAARRHGRDVRLVRSADIIQLEYDVIEVEVETASQILERQKPFNGRVGNNFRYCSVDLKGNVIVIEFSPCVVIGPVVIIPDFATADGIIRTDDKVAPAVKVRCKSVHDGVSIATVGSADAIKGIERSIGIIVPELTEVIGHEFRIVFLNI